jgi:hypothetical protein
MAVMVDANTLTRSWTRAQADRQRALFRSALGFVLVVEAALALVLLVCPVWSASFSVWPAAGATFWVRAAGAMWVVINLLQVPGWFDPVYQRWPNIVGLPWRFLLAAVCACLGGFFWILAVAELVAAVGLSLLYWRLLRAELLCRP